MKYFNTEDLRLFSKVLNKAKFATGEKEDEVHTNKYNLNEF